MKTSIRNSVFLILFSVILFGSCTVQKRRYSSGFHVNWHLNPGKKNLTRVKNKPLPGKRIPVLTTALKSKEARSRIHIKPEVSISNVISLTTKTNIQVPKETSVVQSNKGFRRKLIQNPLFKTMAKVTRKPLQKLGYSINLETLNDPDSEPVKKEMQTQALMSLLFGLLALLMFAITYFGFMSGGIFYLMIPLTIWLGAIIASLVMGIWGTVEFGGEPEKYKGGYLGIIGTLLSILSIVLFVTLIVMI